MSHTITSVLGNQQHELFDLDGRKLLLIFGRAAGTSFVIVPGWYIGNEKYEANQLTAVDVELVDPLEQSEIESKLRGYLKERGLDFRVSFWGASGFPQNSNFPNSSSPSSSSTNERTTKVLVIDDDPGLRKVIKLYLERQGYRVETASSASQALTLLKDSGAGELDLPDLILLDIMMPGATGWQLLKDLENDPKTSKLPVIAISGLERPGKDEEYDSKMLYDYLVKPFSMEELSRVVRKFSNSNK